MHQRVVLIDDDHDLADALAEYLRIEGGHEVRAFTLPDDALAWFVSGGNADIVLLDLRTPGMSPHRFRALLMSIPSLRDLPVIAISGLPGIADVASSIGAVGFLQKPIDPDDLLAMIGQHCRVHVVPEPKASVVVPAGTKRRKR